MAVVSVFTAIGTAIANANGMFAGHSYLAYWFYGAAAALLILALVLAQKKPAHPNTPVTSHNTQSASDSSKQSIENVGNPHVETHVYLPQPESHPALQHQGPPNLVLHGFEMTPIEKYEGGWRRLAGGKMAWLAFIRNAPLGDKDVGLACVRAEILYYPQKGRCYAVSPATWLVQGENTACLKSGDTKDLVIAVETHPRWNWNFLTNGSPCSYGDLWDTCPDFEFEVRLIDDASGQIMKPSYCFKWEWRGESRPSIYVIDKITLQ